MGKLPIKLETTAINLYAGSRIANAAKELTKDMDLYLAVRYAQILEAVYKEGKKDGSNETFTAIQTGVRAAEKAIPHRNPGRPRKKK